MRLVTVTACLIALAAAVPATASAQQIGLNPLGYEVPLPTGTFTVTVAQTDEELRALCQVPTGAIGPEACLVGTTIVVPPYAVAHTLSHEVGHLFETQMTWPQRFHIATLLRRPITTAAEWGDARIERFADAYAACALGLGHRRAGDLSGYGYEPGRAQHRRMCTAIRRYGSPVPERPQF